jgi:hypothetical protein
MKKAYKVITEDVDNTLNEKDTSAIEYIEKNYPIMAKAFQEIQFEQYELFCRKQYNYGKGNIMLGGDIDNTDDRKMALSGLVIRMNDKLNRLMSLILKNKKDVVDESVEDTFIDMANYSIISLLVNRIKWK